MVPSLPPYIIAASIPCYAVYPLAPFYFHCMLMAVFDGRNLDIKYKNYKYYYIPILLLLAGTCDNAGLFKCIGFNYIVILAI